jgi:maltooligosyltrehalose trehalohydrolase
VRPLTPLGNGYFGAVVEGVGDGARYLFDVDGRTLPDPFARFLPDGVHGPARVVESRYAWRHPKPQRPLSEHVIYELHVGTFTPEGTYAAAGGKLQYLAELGVTAVELMPLSSFQGTRGWGYDGVAHFAPFAPYGEPDDLRRFIDDAHGLGLVVLLDVVYNHFGPAGNYLGAYGAGYFTDRYQNAWGQAPDFAGAPMRRYALDNASYWFTEFRVDGLRYDATHAVFDESPRHVLGAIGDRVRALAPGALLIAEDERNDPGCLAALGVQALWADDFHHQLRVTLTGENDGYYAGYAPSVEDLARTIEGGWLYQGQPSPSGRPRGKPAPDLAWQAFVYCIQNHDQIGNRALGTRLCHDVSLDAYCLASTLLLFLPMTPLLFMGQEWAASTPFLYFTDHDPELGALVTAGRRREFAAFAAFSDPARRETIPDPQAPQTFERSKLHWDERQVEPHARVLTLYRELLALRRSDPVLGLACSRAELSPTTWGQLLLVRRRGRDGSGDRVLLANFGKESVSLGTVPGVGAGARVLFGSQASAAQGDIPPLGAVVVEPAEHLRVR